MVPSITPIYPGTQRRRENFLLQASVNPARSYNHHTHPPSRPQGTYISEHLVRGLAPEGITAVDRQRGRWTQGHWQIFFSLRNPLFAPSQLGVRGVLYYNYGTW